MMKTKGDQFQENVLIVVAVVCGQLRRFVRDHRCILRSEGRKIFRPQVGLDQNDDAMGSIEEANKSIDIHKNGTCVVGLRGIKHVGKRGNGEIGWG